MSKFGNLEELQKVLNNTKKGIGLLNKRIDLLKLEDEYQKYISQFSKAYVSGSDWYVGESITEYLKNKKVDTGILNLLFLISHQKNQNKG